MIDGLAGWPILKVDDAIMEEQVQRLRAVYMQRVEALFESQKGLDAVAARKTLRWVPRSSKEDKAR